MATKTATERLYNSVRGDDWQILPGIYESHINIAILQRDLDPNIERFVRERILTGRPLNIRQSIESPEELPQVLPEHLREDPEARAWIDDLTLLVDAWFCLFNVERTGIRITTLDKAMCPRFHVDRVPVRLVSTYGGLGTEWLPNGEVERTVLGQPLNGERDPMTQSPRIQRLDSGDIGLLKGEAWPGNEGNGLVHRSPRIDPPQKRLLFSLDVA